MYIVRILGDETTIDLGRRGENRALAIDFPIDNFIANYGDGMASLAHLRPGDTEPYICETETVVSDGATYLRWVVTDTDTAKAGSGRCELRWNVDDTGDGDPIDDYDTRAKSIIYTTTVHPSLTDETQIPDPYKDWYDTMMATLAPAIDAADSPALQLLNGGTKTTSSSTNLNSFKYVTEGVYYHDGSVTLTNAPVSGQFVMIVREQPMQQNPSDTEYTLSWFTRVLVTLGSAPQVWLQCGQLYRPFTHPPTFFTWRKIPSASDITSIESDLDTLTTTVTANTAGRIGMLSNVNLDDLHTDNTCGVYWLNNYSSDVTGTKPVAEGQGLLIVKKQNGTTYRQTYIAVIGTYFAVRSYSSSSWGEWQSASLQTSLDNKLDLYTGTKIESNTDLNTLTTPGTYFCVNSSTAATLVNSPLTTVGFRLDISRNGYNTDNYLVQTMQAVVTSTVVTYKRGMSVKGTWGAWRQMPTRAEMDIVTGYNTVKTLTASDDLVTLDDGHYRLNSAVPLNAPSGLASNSKYGYVTIQHRGAAGYTYYEYVAGNGDGTTLERHFGWKSTTAGTTITWEA